MTEFDKDELYDMLTVAMQHGTWTDEQLLALLKKAPQLFAFFPRQTPQLCRVAVELRGYNIKHVKEPTYELYLAAVTSCCDALYNVPAKFRTPELESAAAVATIEKFKSKMSEEAPRPVVHVRLWDRTDADSGCFGSGLFLDAYETLEPPWHRQTLYIVEGMQLRTTETTVEFGYYSSQDNKWYHYLKVDEGQHTAIVFHNACVLYVVYEEALQVIAELRARGY